MPLFTAISTVCTKLSTGAVFCAVAATTDVPFKNQDLCDAYYSGRMDVLIETRGANLEFAKGSCETPNTGKMIISSAPAWFEQEGWLYTIKVGKYAK